MGLSVVPQVRFERTTFRVSHGRSPLSYRGDHRSSVQHNPRQQAGQSRVETDPSMLHAASVPQIRAAMAHHWRMAVKHAGTSNLPTLTTPCTLQALRVWLQALDVISPGEEATGGPGGGVQITSSNSAITAT